MKACKIAAVICFIGIAMLGISLYFLKFEGITQNIIIGILTGLVVSFVTSCVDYFTKKMLIIQQLKTILPNAYLNLMIIHNITGQILSRIFYTIHLGELKYEKAIGIVEIAIKSIDIGTLNTYSGVVPAGKTYNAVKNMQELNEQIYNLESCLNNVMFNALKAETVQLEKENELSQGKIVSQEKEKFLAEKKNLITIQTSKIHEYEASLIKEIDKIAIEFIGNKEWNDTKIILSGQLNDVILQEAR